MRLLQLATGHDQLLDLHPNVTVVTDLDADARQRLAEVVAALAEGNAGPHPGLLEAHGVLFDLAPEALLLLDIVPGAVQPVVRAHDLPTVRPAPAPDDAATQEQAQALADVEARHGVAEADAAAAQAALAAAVAEVERIRVELDAAVAGQGSPTEPTDPEPTGGAAGDDPATDEELAALEAALDTAVEAHVAAQAAADEARDRRQGAVALAATIAARLEAARQAADPDAAAALTAAGAVLATAEAQADARAAEKADADQAAEPDGTDEAAPLPDAADDAPADRLERLDEEIEALGKRLAAFGPVDVGAVATCLDRMRSPDGGAALVAMPRATAIADELDALEAALLSTEPIGGTPGGELGDVRSRLEVARQALIEADQAARRPELDRDAVERLEHVHASLLDAIDKADGRFGGARAQRRVDTLRAEENELLDELGLGSYSEYMMGNLLLHVDPEKEAALEAARDELSSVEDEWRAAEAETDAELTRAEQMERRRVLIDEARDLVGHPVTSTTVIDELRALRVEAEPSEADAAELRRALDDAGVALGDDALATEELLLLADAWLTEAGEASDREQSLRAELARLEGERDRAAAALHGGDLSVTAAGDGVVGADEPLDAPDAAVAAARERLREAEDRQQAHLDAEADTLTAAAELAAAAEVERDAADAATAADAALITAARQEEDARAALARHAVERAPTADTPGAAGELTAALALAEAARATAATRSKEATDAVDAIGAERRQAEADLASAEKAAEASRPTSFAEEVEWYLLARLAAQRAVSLGGSLPLLLDDALGGLDDAALEHVLGRLERMAEAVQVIVVTDDAVAASWATRTGPDRAAVVRPVPASMVSR